MFIKNISSLTAQDGALVGAKALGLAYLHHKQQELSIGAPQGFVITVAAFEYFINSNNLHTIFTTLLADLHSNSLHDVQAISTALQSHVLQATLPADLQEAIAQAYTILPQVSYPHALRVAIRSSSLLEDLPDSSFAGQQESFLNIETTENVLTAYKQCVASLFTTRALMYRLQKGMSLHNFVMAVIVQGMVPDQDCAGVGFSIDPYSGCNNTIIIEGAQGLGDQIVKGHVTPDEYRIYKPLLNQSYQPLFFKKLGSRAISEAHGAARYCLTNYLVIALGHIIQRLEQSYQQDYATNSAIDIEWAYSAIHKKFYIVQIRPETVHAQTLPKTEVSYCLVDSSEGLTALAQGHSISNRIVQGRVVVAMHLHDAYELQEGDILVTSMTNPDWMPFLKKAGGIITEHGGRTCHAAIVSRELGIGGIIGAGSMLSVLKTGDYVTIDCTQGSIGYVYPGLLAYTITPKALIAPISDAHCINTMSDIFLTLADPAQAAYWGKVEDISGIGLARTEFIIAHEIKLHPGLCVLPNDDLRLQEYTSIVKPLIAQYGSLNEFFVEKLAHCLATMAAAFYPRPVIMRFSDFKTNEYAHLTGGSLFEHTESNPMMGLRGAARYYHPSYKEAFKLECQALQYARSVLGFTNLIAMIPFVRTPLEATKVLDIMASMDLARGQNALQIYMMIEIPSNIILFEDFEPLFDGFSIGSNDLTQFILAVDRDENALSHIFDERNQAVVKVILQVIKKAKAAGKYIGICGQAPSDYPEFAQLLIEHGIDSLSLNPDSIINFLHNRQNFYSRLIATNSSASSLTV